MKPGRSLCPQGVFFIKKGRGAAFKIGLFFLKNRGVGRVRKLGPPPFFLKKYPMARGPTQAAWFSNQKIWNKPVRWSFLQKLKSARFPSGTTGLVTITHSVFKWAATSHPALSLISKNPPPF